MSDEEHLDIDPCDKDEPGESKAAKAAVKAAAGKVAKKADDKAAADKVDKKAVATKEKRFQTVISAKAASEAVQKEIDDILGGINPDQKDRLLAVMGVVSPNTKCKYDHEATMTRLIANTASVRAVIETLKNDYESVHYMSTLCVYWKGLMPLNRAQTNEHVAFMKHFNKERHHYGLPERGVAEALGDLSFDEDAGAGAD
jgi:hypothetical protein